MTGFLRDKGILFITAINIVKIKLPGYVVEKREGTRRSYVHVGKTDADRTKLTVSNLTEGNDYSFKVYAENRYGTSPALETEQPIVPKRKYGKCPGFLYCNGALLTRLDKKTH